MAYAVLVQSQDLRTARRRFWHCSLRLLSLAKVRQSEFHRGQHLQSWPHAASDVRTIMSFLDPDVSGRDLLQLRQRG